MIATQTATALPAVPLADDAGDIVSAVPRVALKGAADDATVWSLPGGDDGISEPILLGYDDKDRKSGAALLGLKQSQVSFERLKEGVSVVGGTVLGRLGERSLRFEVRPAGVSEPRIDPAPLINGWRQLQHTAIFNPQAATRLAGLGADSTSVGQVLLMSKRELMARVLIDPRITIYACGRRDVETGQIDRRVLAALEFLADSNLYPTVSALKCGHGILTASGNVSEHSTGDAVDIAAINGTPIYQTPGSGLDHRDHDPPPAPAPGRDEAAPDHLADDLPGGRQHARAPRPLRPHPRRLPPEPRHGAAERRPEPPGRRRRALAAHPEPVAAPDDAPQPDRQPARADNGVEVRAD